MALAHPTRTDLGRGEYWWNPPLPRLTAMMPTEHPWVQMRRRQGKRDKNDSRFDRIWSRLRLFEATRKQLGWNYGEFEAQTKYRNGLYNLVMFSSKFQKSSNFKKSSVV